MSRLDYVCFYLSIFGYGIYNLVTLYLEKVSFSFYRLHVRMLL
jgi:hypothetical protein